MPHQLSALSLTGLALSFTLLSSAFAAGPTPDEINKTASAIGLPAAVLANCVSCEALDTLISSPDCNSNDLAVYLSCFCGNNSSSIVQPCFQCMFDLGGSVTGTSHADLQTFATDYDLLCANFEGFTPIPTNLTATPGSIAAKNAARTATTSSLSILSLALFIASAAVAISFV